MQHSSSSNFNRTPPQCTNEHLVCSASENERQKRRFLFNKVKKGQLSSLHGTHTSCSWKFWSSLLLPHHTHAPLPPQPSYCHGTMCWGHELFVQNGQKSFQKDVGILKISLQQHAMASPENSLQCSSPLLAETPQN